MTAHATVDPLKQIGFYFYFPEKRIGEELENYTTLAIVDGLSRLGYPCFSNVAHPNLIEKPLREAGGHVVVFDVTEANYSAALMRGIAEFRAVAKIIHSRADSASGMITPDEVTAVVTHENRFMRFRQKRLPWAFGLSQARIDRHADTTPFAARRPVLLRNFRPAFQQSVRETLDLALVPLLEKYFEIDRAISVDDYPHRLATSVGCLAYCGCYATELTRNSYFASNAGLVELAANRSLLKDTVIARWDSWRFWESLAAGCLTFHLDFETYGFVLPETAVAWKHYVPVDLADPKGTVAELMDRRAEWEAIATAGRAWALEHYSPLPTARRFAALCRAEVLRVRAAA